METQVTVNMDQGRRPLVCNVAVDSIDDDMVLTFTVNHDSDMRSIEVSMTDEIIDAILDEFPMSSIAYFVQKRAEREVAQLDTQIDESVDNTMRLNARRAHARAFVKEEE